MIHRYFEGVLPAASELTDADSQVIAVAEAAVKNADAAIDEIAIQDALSAVWTLVDELNNYITVQEPWVLAKDDSNRARLGTVLNTTAEGLRVLAILLASVTPKASEKLWSALTAGTIGTLANQKLSNAAVWGQLKVGSQLTALEALFPRIESDTESK